MASKVKGGEKVVDVLIKSGADPNTAKEVRTAHSPSPLLSPQLFTLKATFTWERTGTVSNRTGPDRLLFTWNCLEPIQVFTRNRSGTGPETDPKPRPANQQVQFWIQLDPFRTPGSVPNGPV